MTPWEPDFGNFSEDRQCLAEYEPDKWDPEVIGAAGSYLGAMGGKGAAPQNPGGKKSMGNGRVSY